jgi:hypothetical protein
MNDTGFLSLPLLPLLPLLPSLLTPPLAFLAYLLLIGAVAHASRRISAAGDQSADKRALYTGGERYTSDGARPGYAPFFRGALFFAVLHLGALVIGTSDLSRSDGTGQMLLVIYLLGLVATLAVLANRKE